MADNKTPNFMPSPEEIRLRTEVERFMRRHFWPETLIISIMIYDNPTPLAVKQMILNQSEPQPNELRKRLMRFLELEEETLDDFYAECGDDDIESDYSCY